MPWARPSLSASALLEMEALWDTLETAAMPEAARLLMFDQAALALRGHMADLLRACGGGQSPAQLTAEIGPMIAELVDKADSLLGVEARAHIDGIAARMVDKGASAEQARTVARLFAVDGAIGLARLARDTGGEPVALANAFIALGALLGIDWAQSRAAVMSPADPWERLLVAGLARDFQQMRLDFLRGLAGGKSKASSDPEALVCAWADRNRCRHRAVPADDRPRAGGQSRRSGHAGADRQPGAQSVAGISLTQSGIICAPLRL